MDDDIRDRLLNEGYMSHSCVYQIDVILGRCCIHGKANTANGGSGPVQSFRVVPAGLFVAHVVWNYINILNADSARRELEDRSGRKQHYI